MTRTDTDQLHVALGGGGAVDRARPGRHQDRPSHRGERAGREDRSPARALDAPVTPSGWRLRTSTSTTPRWSTSRRARSSTSRRGEFPIATGMDARATAVPTWPTSSGAASPASPTPRPPASPTTAARSATRRSTCGTNYDPIDGRPGGGYGGLPIQIAVTPDDFGGSWPTPCPRS